MLFFINQFKDFCENVSDNFKKELPTVLKGSGKMKQSHIIWNLNPAFTFGHTTEIPWKTFYLIQVHQKLTMLPTQK